MNDKKYSAKVVMILVACCIICLAGCIVAIVSGNSRVVELERRLMSVYDQGYSDSNTSPGDSETPAYNNETVPTTSVTTVKPKSEWGFDNSDDWGNAIVEIQATKDGAVTFSDSTGTFVLINSYGRSFKLYSSSGQLVIGSMGTDFYIQSRESATYTVLNNDTITCYSQDEGNGVFEIIQRIEKADSLIFQLTNNGNPQYYIPVEFLDKSKEPQEYGSDGYYTYYKFYIK